MMIYRRSRTARFASLTALGLAAITLAGCGSNGDDGSILGELIEPIMPPTPSEAARDAFDVYDPDKRRNAVSLIAASPFGHEEPYLRTYRLLADDPDPTVRAAVIKALGMHGTVEDAGLIIPHLKDARAYVRWEAAKALQRIHNPMAVGPLLDLAKQDADADVRMAAASALGQYPQPAVFDGLLGVLNDPNFGVVQAANQSLQTLTGQAIGPDPTAWLAWSNEHRGRLFADQQPYRYQPYPKPPGWIDQMQFWKEAEVPPAEAPTGLESAADGQRPQSS